MKKYLLLFSMFSIALCTKGQDLDNIKKLLLLNKFEQVKPEIDSYLSNEKNVAKAEVWYYKAYAYNSLSRLPNKTMSESKSLFTGAFDAVKKYAEIDPKAPLTAEEKNSTVFNIYYGLYDLGIRAYNEKNYAESYDLFTKTLGVHDYIYNGKITGPQELKLPAHDTDLVWNLAILANELKKNDEAMMYYQKIADADLADEKYVTAYEEMILKYKKENNPALFSKYLAAAKKHYPIDLPYWEMKEIEFAVSDLENEALLGKYEELTQTLPNNFVVFYNYAVEMDKFISTDAAKGKDINAFKNKIEELFKKAISLKSTLEGNLQLANLYYSKTFDLNEKIAKIKGTKPQELKVKNDLIAESKIVSNESIIYAEAAVKFLADLKEYKFTDKSNYKLALEILEHGYKITGNTAKLAEVQKKKAEVDKL